jgi:hypothetical protein
MPTGRAPSSQSLWADRVGADPGLGDEVGHLAWQLRVQAAACAEMGSTLYATLLTAAAGDVERRGSAYGVLRPHLAPGRGDALALRFMAAVHRLVLTRRAPALALHYPSVGGTASSGAAEAFLASVEEHAEVLAELTALPCQTNEVGRTAALVGGFLDVAATTGLPLRCLEVGASAGLNLRWDAFRYGGGGAAWGQPDSPVQLDGHWTLPPPHTAAEVVVTERRGCDPNPVDPATEEGRLALTASVWADQVDRFERLRGALLVAGRVPAHVDGASAPGWTALQLGEPRTGVATVVYHSIVEEYLSEQDRRAFREALEAAGARATADSPLAWLRLEPVSALRRHGLTLRTWPGGDDRVLATCGAHGQDVRWSGGPG